MKKLIIIFLLLLISCADKPYYTRTTVTNGELVITMDHILSNNQTNLLFSRPAHKEDFYNKFLFIVDPETFTGGKESEYGFRAPKFQGVVLASNTCVTPNCQPDASWVKTSRDLWRWISWNPGYWGFHPSNHMLVFGTHHREDTKLKAVFWSNMWRHEWYEYGTNTNSASRISFEGNNLKGTLVYIEEWSQYSDKEE